MSESQVCPSCGFQRLRRHCDIDEAHCPWLRCDRCKSYGYPHERWWNAERQELVRHG